MNLTEKVSYLKGLMDGLDVGEATKEGKILSVMADILQDMAVAAEDIQDQVDEVVEVVDMLDEDLGEIEKDYYGFDDDDECCGDDCDCCDDDDEDDLYEVVCPSCGDTICLNEGMLEEGSMTCPGCGELLEFDLSDEDGAQQ